MKPLTRSCAGLLLAWGAACCGVSHAAYDLGNLSVASPVFKVESYGADDATFGAPGYLFHIDVTSVVSGTIGTHGGFETLPGTGGARLVRDVAVDAIDLLRYDIATHTYVDLGLTDHDPSSFSFAGLAAGDYRLNLSGRLLPGDDTVTGVDNAGLAGFGLLLGAAPASVPAPATLALVLGALVPLLRRSRWAQAGTAASSVDSQLGTASAGMGRAIT